MCLAPSMPSAPTPSKQELPPPPPSPVIAPGAQPTTIKPTLSSRQSLKQASKGTSSLTIPLSIGGMAPTTAPGIGGMTTSSNLTIGK